MTKRKGKPVSFDAMVKFFMMHYNIPTKSDIEKLNAKLDHLENLIKSIPGPVKSKSENKPGGRTPSEKAVLTSSDMVLEIVKSFQEGVGFAEIQSRSGFENKKLRNIIFRLNKIGKIRRKNRGCYTAS
ncbi:MAG: hypothetical protein Q8P24_19110 [Desulfobacterales bacterium]|nr:hypothetical protein [Desulfobacterales bacterium]